MTILGLRILPPLASARFGSSTQPLDAFSLEISREDPLGFRQIVPRPTFQIDPNSGAIARQYTPPIPIRFKDGDLVRPVAPFLELFAQTSADTLEPLTLGLLASEGLGPQDVMWTVRVANLKVFRQTNCVADKIIGSVHEFSDHAVHELRGTCDNFVDGKYIPFGNVRYVRPTEQFPEIRLRFTPATGKVYGASPDRFDPDLKEVIKDPVFVGHEDRIVYDAKRGSWLGFQANSKSKTLPNPSDIYQGYWPDDPDQLPISWGYLDDVCDGPVSVTIRTKDRMELSARAWIASCMPAYAPDSLPLRTVADELEQLILGPEVADEEVSIDDAAKIVHRAIETIRLMNTSAMNGNVIDGRANVASTLVRQDTNDFGRQYAPVMAPSLADTLAVCGLHERIYAALKSGSAPWFSRVLRRPEEIGDMSDEARRKMPPMLRGADGRALTLTRRQISKIVKAARFNIFRAASEEPKS